MDSLAREQEGEKRRCEQEGEMGEAVRETEGRKEGGGGQAEKGGKKEGLRSFIILFNWSLRVHDSDN